MKEQITILGAGISGRGAALLASSKGYEVFVSEKGTIDEGARKLFEEKGISFEEGGHSQERILGSSIIVKSPGIPPDVEVIAEAVSKGIPVIDELEFAGKFLDKPCVLITGTNGKTTTTLLTAHLLNSCGIQARAVGNVGESLAEALIADTAEMYVIEASSYQLDGMNEFQADVAVLLNITPDHLDRYGSMENYIASKTHIRDLLKDDGWVIYNLDDPNINMTGNQIKPFSIRETTWAFMLDKKFIVGELFRFDSAKFSLKGEHNLMNALASITTCLKFTDDLEGIERGLQNFRTAPHRLEWIEQINGVDFVNDSKATNVEAVKFALGSFENPLVWIAGGVDKGNDYQQIKSLVGDKVHSLVCMGIDNQKLMDSFREDVSNIADTNSMEEAVKSAWGYANPEDVVLLSPACASFDLFDNYIDRGEQFREEVLKLKENIERGAYEQG